MYRVIGYFFQCILVFSILGCSPKLPSNVELENQIVSYFEFEKDTFSLADSIFCKIIVINSTDQVIFIPWSPFNKQIYYIRGQMLQYWGVRVWQLQPSPNLMHPDLSLGSKHGGCYWKKLEPQERIIEVVDLKRFATFKKPGDYQVVARKIIGIHSQNLENKKFRYWRSRNSRNVFIGMDHNFYIK